MQEKGAKRKTFVAPSTINRELGAGHFEESGIRGQVIYFTVCFHQKEKMGSGKL
ncbi:MAG: hypothetical protein PVH61_21805 [Candidatus Aminicenantes bacterium]|jgi:hypothetical protein